jgi:hypothetical protein
VTVQEIVALMQRHLVALMIVVAVAAGVAYALKRTPMTYQESGTVAFTVTKSATNPNPYASSSDALIDAAGIITLMVMSPQGQQQVRAAGGAGAFDAALVNNYNLQFPLYNQPYVTVTAASTNPADVQRTFIEVTQMLYHDLSAQQAEAHVPTADRIAAHMVADTGTVTQPGSSKRTFAGLLVLMIVAAFSVAIFLDRHRIRLRGVPWFRQTDRPRRPARLAIGADRGGPSR